MKNPRINRIIGYIVMMIGFVLFYRGFHYPTAQDPVNGKNWVLIIVSLLIVIGALIWMIKKVRCPYCNQLLDIKSYNIDICPHCGRRIG